MSMINCECRASCTGLAVAASLIIGVIAAFLQITDVLAVSAVFLWVFFGIAVGALAIGLATCGGCAASCGTCRSLRTLLVGALGTILVSLILLAIPAALGGVVGAILVGVLVFFFFLLIISAACLVRARCD